MKASDYPMIIFVWLSGVGKSTAVGNVQKHFPESILLPNRRSLTDEHMFPVVQVHEWNPVTSVAERGERFRMTWVYRSLFPAGMAHVLNELDIRAPGWSMIMFDGLRGENEIAAGADFFPDAKLIMFDLPFVIRIERILGRGDSFDLVDIDTENLFPGIDELLDEKEKEKLLALAEQWTYSIADLQRGWKIIQTERRNYADEPMRAAVREKRWDRGIIIDTSENTREETGQQCIDFILWR